MSEVEVLGFDITTKIKGGKDDVIELPEVVVIDTYSPSYDNFYYFMPSLAGGDGGYGGADGGGGYGGGSTILFAWELYEMINNHS